MRLAPWLANRAALCRRAGRNNQHQPQAQSLPAFRLQRVITIFFVCSVQQCRHSGGSERRWAGGHDQNASATACRP